MIHDQNLRFLSKWQFELQQDDEVGDGDGDHAGEGAACDLEHAAPSQGLCSVNTVQDHLDLPILSYWILSFLYLMPNAFERFVATINIENQNLEEKEKGERNETKS